MDHFELASALRGVVSDLHKRLRKQTYSADELSLTEASTLSYLYKHGSLFPSELAELNKIRKQSMSQALSRLEEMKLIKRVASKEDKRKMAISLTAAAEKIVEKSRHERDVWLAGAIREMVTEKDVRVLAAAIPLLERIANAK
jgi:DNA-binding MarR family transcriptional regulator